MDFTYYLKGLQAGKTKRHAIGDKPDEEFGIIMPLSNDWVRYCPSSWTRSRLVQSIIK